LKELAMSVTVPPTVAPMIPRTLFNADHEAFPRHGAPLLRRPRSRRIKRSGRSSSTLTANLWNKAGELGLLCCTMPEEFGGSGVDRLYSVILMEEQARVGDSASAAFSLHSDIVANYIINFGTPAQKLHWLPKMASGEAVTAIAMTEPGTGSDLQGISAPPSSRATSTSSTVPRSSSPTASSATWPSWW
jgi:alkylation response protein AidB-like acyl-CoA dehydrogenase